MEKESISSSSKSRAPRRSKEKKKRWDECTSEYDNNYDNDNNGDIPQYRMMPPRDENNDVIRYVWYFFTCDERSEEQVKKSHRTVHVVVALYSHGDSSRSN